MSGNTINKDLIIEILEGNLGASKAKKVLQLISGIDDVDRVISKLEWVLDGEIPATKLSKLVQEFTEYKNLIEDGKKTVMGAHRHDGTANLEDTFIGLEPKEYFVEDELGRGGMGAVLRVEDKSLKRNVALKTIIGSASDHAIKRFIREAEITGKLEHPNIIPIHDHGKNSNGVYYFTMKQVKGQDLAEIIDGLSDGRPEYNNEFPLNRLLQIYTKILDAMNFAHSKNIIHRDLKPSNIMVGEFGEVLVMDWGLAKEKSEEDFISDDKIEKTDQGLTLDGQIMGSPGYMPPEQAGGSMMDVDEQSDVWSLGAILYEMLCYEVPIEGNNSSHVLVNTAMGNIIPITKRRKYAPNIPRVLESIVMKALHPNKDIRYKSVRALQDDITAFLENRNVSAHNYSLGHHIINWMKRHPTIAVGSSVALFLLLAGSVTGGLLYQRGQIQKLRADAETTRADKAERAEERALDQRDAAQMEVKGQQRAQAILDSLKFLRQDEGYYDAALSIINDAIKASNNYWRPYLVLAKHHADFGHHKKAEMTFELANVVYRKQFGEFSTEIWFEAGMYYGLPAELGGPGLEERALKYFERAHQAGPNETFGKLSRLISLVLKANQELGKAEEYLSEAVELSNLLIENDIAKNIDATWLARAWVYGIPGIKNYEIPAFKKFADLEKARDALLRVVDEEQGNLLIRNFLAIVQRGLGEYDAAIRILSNRIKNKQTGMFHINRGAIYVNKGELEKAIADYNEAIRLNPQYAKAYNNRGLAYEKKGELEKAIADYNEAIRLNPDFAAAYNHRGNVYQKKGDLEKAIRDYDEAIRLNPNFAVAYNNRGIAYENKGELEKAIMDFDQAIRLDPNFADAYNNCGIVHQKKGELEKAILFYDEAIRLNPQFAKAYNNRGNAHQRKSELEKAILDFDEAIRLNPQFAKAYSNRGFVHQKKGELEKAIADYDEAIRLNPRDTISYNNRGNAYKTKGELEKAIADYTETVRLNPQFWQAHGNLGICLNEQRLYEEAIDAFQNALRYAPASMKTKIQQLIEQTRGKIK
jgi:tetratricopeptide (TPR) repeat protein